MLKDAIHILKNEDSSESLKTQQNKKLYVFCKNSPNLIFKIFNKIFPHNGQKYVYIMFGNF